MNAFLKLVITILLIIFIFFFAWPITDEVSWSLTKTFWTDRSSVDAGAAATASFMATLFYILLIGTCVLIIIKLWFPKKVSSYTEETKRQDLVSNGIKNQKTNTTASYTNVEKVKVNRPIPFLYLVMSCAFFYFLLSNKFGLLDIFELEELRDGEFFVFFFIALGVTVWGFILIAGGAFMRGDWRSSTAYYLFWGYIVLFAIAFLLELFGGVGSGSYLGDCISIGRNGRVVCG